MTHVIFFCWWMIGLILVIHEMRHDMDISLGWFVMALWLAVCGPLWAFMSLRRVKWVMFRKYGDKD